MSATTSTNMTCARTLLLGIYWCLLPACLTPTSSTLQTPLTSWNDVNNAVLSGDVAPGQLAAPGPFNYRTYANYTVPLSPDVSITMDLVLSQHSTIAPLLVIQHGNDFNKLAHRQQGERLASWGFHCAILDLPNRNRWLANGELIAKLAQLIDLFPTLVQPEGRLKGIILVGHSFGGSAVTIAAAQGAPVTGLILLDPALVASSVVASMKAVHVPVAILGADPKVFRARHRASFFQHIPSPRLTIDIRGATHNDAQLPSINSVRWGFDFVTTRDNQETFLRAILISAFSIAGSGKLNFAWNTFSGDLKKGIVSSAKVHFVSSAVTQN